MPFLQTAALAAGAGADLASIVQPFLPTGGDNSDYVKHRLVKTVRDAKEAGIHPLYALGSAGSYSPGFSIDGGTAGKVAESVQNLGHIAQRRSAEADAKAAAGVLSPLEQAQLLSMQAAAERDHSAALLSQSEIALNTQRMQSQNRDRIGTMLDSAIAHGDEFGSFTPPLFKNVSLPDGTIVPIIDTNLAESGEVLGALGAAYTMQQGASKALQPAPQPGDSRYFGNLRRWLQRLRKKKPASNGWKSGPYRGQIRR